MESECRDHTTTGTQRFLKEFSHATLSYFGHIKHIKLLSNVRKHENNSLLR